MNTKYMPVTGVDLVDTLKSGILVLFRDSRFRYTLVGGVSAALFCGLFATGLFILEGDVSYLPIAVGAHIVSAVVVYPLHRAFVFRRRVPWLAGFARFYLVFGGGFVFSVIGLAVLVEMVGLPVLGAQAVMIVVLLVVGYLLQRFWVFGAKCRLR